ncbi:hypothetical protein MIMGU_mgv1a011630mg [Erythranthe guttata]|uniref:t-SNARE coiled-coil homology domain-containing protein n=1 Tax=Erythranthe guttata TaxID=4155 RepID=A0A022RFX1_ERYGU|nr:PREDICTED: syntaxin-121-like [Erythranthe guttata]EYU38683.1 hypothetical protein MIMGU_mgv1a011630mg [Erythranthe guttata]|eukprot:XP_012836165.1 PREDICTED: syntaxin-121-like [Erythranthe guttata]
MNDLFSAGSLSRYGDQGSHSIEMTTGGVNLDRFFKDVESIKDELTNLETLHAKLNAAHEQSKTLHNAAAIKDLRSQMDADVAASLKKAKLVKVKLEALDRSNAANRSVPGCGPGSSSDRTRNSVVNGLRKNLHDAMNRFNDLRQKMVSEYRETVQRIYYTVTGENPDEKVLDRLIETGKSENLLQKAIQEQGRGMDTVMEIQERHDAVKEMEKNLMKLHQVFLDMAVLVQSQGEQLNDIEGHVLKAKPFIKDGTEKLQTAKNSKKCFGLCVCLFLF